MKEALEQYEAAAENYQIVIDTWPESAFAERAQWSRDLLGQYEANEFYEDFYATAAPVPPGQGGGLPPTGTDAGGSIEDLLDPGGLEDTGGFEFESDFGEEFYDPDAEDELPPSEYDSAARRHRRRNRSAGRR